MAGFSFWDIEWNMLLLWIERSAEVFSFLYIDSDFILGATAKRDVEHVSRWCRLRVVVQESLIGQFGSHQ